MRFGLIVDSVYRLNNAAYGCIIRSKQPKLCSIHMYINTVLLIISQSYFDSMTNVISLRSILFVNCFTISFDSLISLCSILFVNINTTRSLCNI